MPNEPYRASESDLPAALFEKKSEASTALAAAHIDPPRRRFIDARVEVLHQVRELGLSISDADITLCSIILFSSWEDEEQKRTGGNDGHGKAE
jgi:hypothetical protein